MSLIVYKFCNTALRETLSVHPIKVALYTFEWTYIGARARASKEARRHQGIMNKQEATIARSLQVLVVSSFRMVICNAKLQTVSCRLT